MGIEHLKILIVEDEAAHAEAISRVLKAAEKSVEIRVAGTLREYRRFVANETPDIALMDLNLPDGRAMEVLTYPPENGEFPIMIMTAYGNEQMAVDAIKAGALDYVVKSPEAFTVMSRAVERTLREWKMLQENRRADEALRESEEKYRHLVENLGKEYVFYRHDTNGVFTYVSPSLTDMLGYSQQEALSHFTEFLSDNPVNKEVVRHTDLSIQGLQQPPYEVEIVHKDGSLRWLEVTEYPVRNQDGRVVAVEGIVRDITERKHAEEALRKSETRYRYLFQNMLEGYAYCKMLYDDQNSPVDFVYLEVNNVFERLTGLKNVVGKHVSEVIPGIRELSPELFEIYGRVALSGEPEKFEFDFKSLSQWLSISVYSSEKGYFVAVFDNITERKRMEEALKQSEEVLRSVIDNIGIGVSLISPKMEILMLNRQMLQWFPATDASKKPICYSTFNAPPREEICSYCPTCKTLRDGEIHESMTETPEGNGIRNYRVLSSPVRDKDGNITAAIEVVEDVTERKRAEEALRESERQYRQLVDNALVGVYRSTPEGKFLYVNDALARIFECENADEMLLLPVGIRYKRPEDRETFLNILKEQGKVPYFELEVPTKTGKLKTIVISAVLEDNIISGMVADITERKHLEAQLRHAQKMDAVGTLAGGIAHDFNNILNVIIGYGSMLLERMEADSLSEGQMNEVLAAAERAAVLTKRLLAFSRKQLTEVKPVNVNETVLSIQKMLARLIGEDIDFQLDLEDRSLAVMADTGQIEQVLMNLVSNARDAMPNGGRLMIGTGLQEVDDEYIALNGYGTPGMYALITVADTGIGMDAETQKKIFEPFFTTKGIGEGTGLGLAISYGIIKQHSGYIKVYSEPGQGTVFKIYLPLIEESASLYDKTEALVPVRGGKETVLVAEDDADLRKLTRIVLESFGYSVITAEDGEDAITKFMENRERIDLAMLDMIMPKKNGKEVSEVLRKASPGIKILLASGYTMDIIKNKELTESHFDFIHKPIRPQDLLRKVREILDR